MKPQRVTDPLTLWRPAVRWFQRRAWSGLLYWSRDPDGPGRVVQVVDLPLNQTPSEARL